MKVSCCAEIGGGSFGGRGIWRGCWSRRVIGGDGAAETGKRVVGGSPSGSHDVQMPITETLFCIIVPQLREEASLPRYQDICLGCWPTWLWPTFSWN